jgi:signal transduction histidine kinase
LRRINDISDHGFSINKPEKKKAFSGGIKPDPFTGGIAHDLNTILTTISGYAEMMAEDLPANSPFKDTTLRIVSAVARARSLTDRILVSEKQNQEDKIAVNVNDVLKESIDFVRPSLPPEITVNCDIPVSEISVYAEPLQLLRVFFNLVTNAVHSMEGRGGILSIGVRVLGRNKVKSIIKKDILSEDYVSISFNDTGSGIDASLSGKIFEPYFTTKEQGVGTGLGLSVVREIVNELNGEVQVTSDKNYGTVFDIYLPIYKEFN